MKESRKPLRRIREYLAHRGRDHRENQENVRSSEILHLSDVSVPGCLPPAVEAALSQTDWEIRDVVIGFVNGWEQMEKCLSGNYYYTYTSAFPQGDRQVRYVALYQRSQGVTHYGRVTGIYQVLRKRIPGKARWPEEPCWVYLVEKWLTMEPILPQCYGPNPVSRTSFFLLRQAKIYPELHLESAEAFRFVRLLREETAARKESRTVGGFTLGRVRVLFLENRVLLFRDGVAVMEAAFAELEQWETTRRFLQMAGLHFGKYS